MKVMTRLPAARSLFLALCVLCLGGTPSSAQVEAERWMFTATARESVTDNLFLIPDGPGEAISSGTLSFNFFRLARASQLSAYGWANGQLFSSYRAYNSVQGGLGVFGRRDFDPRFRGHMGLSYADGLNLEALYSSRVGLPQLDIQSFVGTAGLSYAASPSTSLTTDFEATAIRYRADALLSAARLPPDQSIPPGSQLPEGPEARPEGPAPPDASLEALGIVAAESLRVLKLDWWTWRASAGLTQEVSARARLSLSLGYRQTGEDPRAFAAGEQLEAQTGLRYVIDPTANLSFTYDYQDNRFFPSNRVQTFLGQGEKEFGSKVKADGSLGASYLDAGDPYVSGWTVVGGAGVSVRLKHTYLYARYSHSRYQALVLGRNQDFDIFFGSLGHTLTRRVSIAAFGSYRNTHDPVSDLYSYDTGLVGGSLTGLVAKRVSVGLSYYFRHFHTRAFPAADGSLLSFFVRYRRVSK